MTGAGEGAAPNVLWIMADQLRFDYLGCAGHPHLKTPNIDALAARGVRFDNAYVQSPVCGPSRMSAYTGRYVRSHGATWNGLPLPVGTPTLGDHLREGGVRAVLVGKTHMVADADGMARLGIDPASSTGVRVAECGFEPFERDDGLHPNGPDRAWSSYDEHLASLGLVSDNPWEDFANSGLDAHGELRSGWFLDHSHLAANVPEAHSETAWMTDRAIECLTDLSAGDAPWLCHLSYIKPHWPYIVPSPYHDRYGVADVPAPVRADAERDTDHPLLRAYLDARVSRNFADDAVRMRVVPAYMGLVAQLDDHLGRLFAWMDERGLTESTIVVFCSDHGDYLGDHWMGDKDFFHDAAAKVPLIIADPRPEADAARGTVESALVEMIDLAPTFLSALSLPARPHVLEGRDLTPLLHGEPGFERTYAISEHDYSALEVRAALGVRQEDARTIMIRDARWKLIHCEGFRPVLFDLATDPDELVDLGASEAPEHREVRARVRAVLLAWATRHHARVTATAERVEAISRTTDEGVLIGFRNEAEFAAATGETWPHPPRRPRPRTD